MSRIIERMLLIFLMNDVLLTKVTILIRFFSVEYDEFVIIVLLTVNVFLSATDFGLPSDAWCVVGWSPFHTPDKTDKKCSSVLSSVK